MRKLIFRFAAVLSLSAGAIAADSDFQIPAEARAVLENYCYECHDEDLQKGKVQLDRVGELSLNSRLDLLNKIQEQVYFEEMPPKKKDQPSVAERQLLADWVASQLHKHDASKLEDKLRYPDYGNAVDHDKLFSGEIELLPFTPIRRWLVSPQIFTERVIDVFRITDHRRNNALFGITNPFVLPERSGVRYYDNSILDGGHLLIMLSNVEWISYKQIYAARVKAGEIKAGEFPNPKDRWFPSTPEAFEKIITQQTPPAREDIEAAIQNQFDLVLHRPANKQELQKYVDLTKEAIELGGNSEGLRQMLVSVLLEPEFLYRMEMGDGEPDEHGRTKLSPHEAAFAISYALGDRNPDEALRNAANEGNLNTKADFKREVLRLLDHETYYAGEVDKSLGGKNMRAHKTTHPKIVRFFREFFGYPAATRVFKDVKRGEGVYQNPSRGTSGTPGFLIDEADRIVDHYVQRDENVFENLLTTEEFFVYHNRDNEEGSQIISEWTEVYEKLKDTEWKTDPGKVRAENFEFLKSKPSLRIRESKNPVTDREIEDFARHMYFFEETIGKGQTPFTTVPWAHGYYYNHSRFYSLLPTPMRGRYDTKRLKTLDDSKFWDYPIEQPFKLDNRKGILTHPAWLIAHSHNFHTDPIKRGRWIREKLLAGRVPDVPITVDAQIPEAPHKTLRERVEAKTEKAECWKCHEHMNPLGYPFEVYDDFGRFRLDEPLEHEENLVTKKDREADIFKTKKVVTTGFLKGTGDPDLDGEVDDPIEIIDRLAKSDRVRQSIIRHAFRFYMGRNEMLSDSQTLIDADNAYLDSGGSFKSVIVSLLTSDSFIYRKNQL